MELEKFENVDPRLDIFNQKLKSNLKKYIFEFPDVPDIGDIVKLYGEGMNGVEVEILEFQKKSLKERRGK